MTSALNFELHHDEGRRR